MYTGLFSWDVFKEALNQGDVAWKIKEAFQGSAVGGVLRLSDLHSFISLSRGPKSGKHDSYAGQTC